MLEGINRSRPKSSDLRLPITKDMLFSVINFLPFVCNSCYECHLFQAMFSVAYHGLLRIGELAYTGQYSRHVIQMSDVKYLENGLVQVRVPSSKTDQCGIGSLIFLKPQANVAICPCKLLHKYLRVRPDISGPLFCHFDGIYVTRYQFVSILKKALTRSGLQSKNFCSHSFRIGCATSLAMEGVPDDIIMQLGRWKSNSYKLYIRA